MGELDTATLVADSATREVAHDDDGTVAWIAALPLALVAVPLIALLAGPVGTLVSPHADTTDLLPWAQHYFRPEAREQGLYLLSLAVPLVLALVVVLAGGRVAALPPQRAARLALLARAALGVTVLACIVAQYQLRYEWTQGPPRYRFFTPATLLAGALIAGAIATAARSAAVRRRAHSALRESPARRTATGILVLAITALWMLHAPQTDSSIAWAPGGIMTHMAYTSDETFAVVNGLTPLVDANPLYATLWPYLLALPLIVLGKTLLVLTLTTSAITLLALLAAFGILRRATGSSLSALLLYLPFLATGLFVLAEDPSNGFTTAAYLADFPLRYAAPLLLAWLTARELERPAPRAPWALFAAAGLVLVNNVSVGLPALGATVATVALSGRTTRRFWLAAAGGLLLALAAVALLTLVRAGALPRFGQLFEFSHWFLAGFGATPMHGVLGLHLVLYLTYVAALVTAVVRLRGRAPGRALTGMLLWNGLFGLGILSYFVAESGPLWLTASFSTWALTLMLLAFLVVRGLARRAPRWPDPAGLAVLLGTGVMVCSLAQATTPWSQLARLRGAHHGLRRTAAEVRPYVPDPRARAFVASLADGQRFYLKRGAPVALLFENSHRVADAYDVVNVSPYANAFELFARASLRRVVAALRRAGGNTVVMSVTKEPAPDVEQALIDLGFGLVTKRGIVRVRRPVAPATRQLRGETLIKWVDLRNLHPRALREDRGRLVARTRLLAAP
jgi:hypothetical protein